MEYKNWTIFPECTQAGVDWKAVKDGNQHIKGNGKSIGDVKREIDILEEGEDNGCTV